MLDLLVQSAKFTQVLGIHTEPVTASTNVQTCTCTLSHYQEPNAFKCSHLLWYTYGTYCSHAPHNNSCSHWPITSSFQHVYNEAGENSSLAEAVLPDIAGITFISFEKLNKFLIRERLTVLLVFLLVIAWNLSKFVLHPTLNYRKSYAKCLTATQHECKTNRLPNFRSKISATIPQVYK